ncbi:MAG: Amidohydrolase [Lentisphaerae bacterium ADurb.Bin082]|nr:MAG: Amidohydrolase [Lentisphaerae bacterium ADurb.Bin082]
MSGSERVDVHTHAFHPKIAEKVLRQLEAHYRIPPIGTGLWEDLQPRLARCRISRAFVHSAATSPEQVIPANRWACSLRKIPAVTPFGTMHPAYEKMSEELAFLWDHGVRGIKLHPDFQGFRLDDPGLLPLFGAMEGQFTLMVHVGDNLPPAENPSCPWKVAAIKRRFPRLQIIAAHFGGYRHWQYVVEAMAGMEIYMDTSSSLFAIPQHLLEQIFQAFPRHLFLYGSDYPLWDPESEIARLQERLRLTDAELEEILTNGSRLGL